MATKSATILIRRDTAANFTSADPILLLGEWALETNTEKIKIGDGSTAWTSLGYKIEAVLTSSEKTSIGTAEQSANKNEANGYCPLDAGKKVPLANLPNSIVGQLEYRGVWNADTNIPTMPVAASGNTGNYYIVSVAGDTDVNGITDWEIGDWLVSNGATWDKIDNTDKVSSVAGKTGPVTLDLDDISETNDKKIMTSSERTKLSGIDPLASVKSKLNATAAPTINNDITEGYGVGSVWIDLTNDDVYICVDNTDGAAVWTENSLSAAEIKTMYESNDDTNAYDDDAVSKLGGIEALADVTDATNVAAAGAIMENDTIDGGNA